MRMRGPSELLRSSSRRLTLSSSTQRPLRVALLLAIAAVHLLMILWLMTRPPDERSASKEGGTLILFAPTSGKSPASAPRKQTEPPRTTKSTPVPPPPIEMPSVLPTVAQVAGAAEPSTIGGSGGCQLAADAGAAIRLDPAAMAELAALPPGVRTEADAVMLWNGRWLGDASSPAPPTNPPPAGELRRVVETVVAAAPAECRDAAAIGPVFMPIPETGRTTMLVIGSGKWRWSDVLGPEVCRPEAGNSCPASVNAR